MVSTRSAFSAFCLFLGLQEAFSGRSSMKKSSDQGVDKFGCVFENENYYVRTNSEFDPVYGQEVEPMNFANKREFQDVLVVIYEEYAKLMVDMVFDNSPPLFDFFDSYINYFNRNKVRRLLTSKSKSFKTFNCFNLNKESRPDKLYKFYETYVPKFPRQECTGMAMEMLDRLVRVYGPRMGRSVHLVTASLRATQDLLFGLRDLKEPPRFPFKHDHAAAILRFRLPGNRLGYVLMDPGWDLEHPVVIMEDTQPPHSPLSGVSKAAMYFNLLNTEYLTAARFLENGNVRTNVYYIAKPYCSSLMTTTKAHIVDENSPIILERHDFKGMSLGFIIFDTSDQNPVFDISVHTTDGDQLYQSKAQIPFGKCNFSLFDQEQKYFYNLTLDAFHYAGLEDIFHKAEVIARHKQFQTDLLELRKYVTEKTWW